MTVYVTTHRRMAGIDHVLRFERNWQLYTNNETHLLFNIT